MNQFKLNKVTGALIAAGLVLPASFSYAQTSITPTVSATDRGPRLGATMFVGGDGPSKIRVTSAIGTSAEGAGGHALQVHCFVGTSAAAPATAFGIPDGNGATNAQTFIHGSPFTTACGTNAGTQIVLVYDTSATGTAGDFINGTINQFAVVSAAGTIGAGATTAVGAAAAGVAAGNALAVNANYTGPIITSASQTGVGAVTLTYNANLSGDVSGTTGVSAAANLGVLGKKVVDGGNVGTSTILVVSTSSSNILTMGTSTAGAGFTSSINKAEVTTVTSNLFDTAGNAAETQTVYTNFSGTTGVALASGAAQAIGSGFAFGTNAADRVDAWNPAASLNGVTGTFTIALRTNELINIGGTAAVSITAPLTVTGFGTANGTDRTLTVQIPVAAGNEVGFGTTGQLLVTTNNWGSSTAVTVGLSQNTSAVVSVAASGTQMATTGVAAVAVMAGASALPTTNLLTLDSNIDGMLDGVTVRTNDLFNLTYSAAAPTLATAAGSGLSLIADSNTTTFASTTTVNSTIQVNVVLNVLTASNDWNGDGTVSALDTSMYNLTSSGTGVTNPLFRLSEAAVNLTTGASGLNYSNVFRAFDGGVLPFSNLETATVLTTFVDNAPPVVMSVKYDEQSAAGAIENNVARDAYGDILIVHSEAIEALFLNLGSLLFGGTPSTLWNLNANIDHQVVPNTAEAGKDPFGGLDLPGSQVRLQNMPATVVSQVLTYPTGVYPTDFNTHITETGGVAPDYLAVISSVAANNTVSIQAPTQAEITGARLRSTFSAGQKADIVIVDFSEAVIAQGNLNGVFVVRARVGEGRGPVFENRDAGVSVDGYYDFITAASNIAIGTNGVGGANSITITIQDAFNTTKGLPVDTTEIFVDYQPNGGNRLVRASDLAPVPTTDGFLFFSTTSAAAVDVNETPGTNPIREDLDTVKVALPKLFLANKAGASSKNLLTQTVGGKLDLTATTSAPGNVGMRADLIRVVNTGTKEAGQREAVLQGNDGRIEVRRGPNSETAIPQVIGLKNNGGLVIGDLTGLYAALRNFNKALKDKKVTATMSANEIYALMKNEVEALRKYDIDAYGEDQPFSNVPANAGINAFVEVTTGAGALASSGSNGANNTNLAPEAYSQNANAEFGRTATLLKTLPNIQKNGTTYYPVRILLSVGNNNIQPLAAGLVVGNNPIIMGTVPFMPGNPFPADSTEQCRFEVMDTAYALTKVQGTQAFYSVTVGSAEAAFTTASGPLDPAIKDAFILISARNPLTGNYTLLNSADASFTNHIKFTPDLKSNGKLTEKDFALTNVAVADVQDSAGWQLIGVVGELDRSTTNPLDPRAWLGVKDSTGAPVTNFACDNSAKDEAFVLGTDATVANSVKVAFEGAGGTLVNNLRPAKAAGIAFNANALAKAADDALDDLGQLSQVAGNWTPTTGAVRKVPKLFLPIKPGAINLPKLLKSSWHLVTVQTTALTFGQLTAKGFDAAIIVDALKGATAWFTGEPATAHLDATAIKQGTAIFLHVGGTDVNNIPL